MDLKQLPAWFVFPRSFPRTKQGNVFSRLTFGLVAGLVFFGSEIRAQEVKFPESFEREEEVSPAWKVSDGGVTEIVNERFKSGHHSLRWAWTRENASLTFRHAGAFLAGEIEESREQGRTLAFYVYQERPSDGLIRFELLNGEETVGHFWVSANFWGWRVVGTRFSWTGWDVGQNVDGFRIHSPEGVQSGRLYIDYFQPAFASAGPPPNSIQPWAQFPERIGDEEELLLSLRDLAVNRPWIPELKPEDALKGEETELMKALVAEVHPVREKQPKVETIRGDELLSQVREKMTAVGVGRKNGIVYGKPVGPVWFFPVPDQIDFLKDYVDAMLLAHQLILEGRKESERAEGYQHFVDLADHLLDQGWQPGNAAVGPIEHGEKFIKWTQGIVDAAPELRSTGRMVNYALLLEWLSGGDVKIAELRGEGVSVEYSPMDLLWLQSITLLPSSPFLYQRIEIFREYFRKLIVSESVGGGMDGTGGGLPIKARRVDFSGIDQSGIELAQLVNVVHGSGLLSMESYVDGPRLAVTRAALTGGGNPYFPQVLGNVADAEKLVKALEIWINLPEGTGTAPDPFSASVLLALAKEPYSETVRQLQSYGLQPMKLQGLHIFDAGKAVIYRSSDGVLAWNHTHYPGAMGFAWHAPASGQRKSVVHGVRSAISFPAGGTGTEAQLTARARVEGVQYSALTAGEGGLVSVRSMDETLSYRKSYFAVQDLVMVLVNGNVREGENGETVLFHEMMDVLIPPGPIRSLGAETGSSWVSPDGHIYFVHGGSGEESKPAAPEWAQVEDAESRLKISHSPGTFTSAISIRPAPRVENAEQWLERIASPEKFAYRVVRNTESEQIVWNRDAQTAFYSLWSGGGISSVAGLLKKTSGPADVVITYEASGIRVWAKAKGQDGDSANNVSATAGSMESTSGPLVLEFSGKFLPHENATILEDGISVAVAGTGGEIRLEYSAQEESELLTFAKEDQEIQASPYPGWLHEAAPPPPPTWWQKIKNWFSR